LIVKHGWLGNAHNKWACHRNIIELGGFSIAIDFSTGQKPLKQWGFPLVAWLLKHQHMSLLTKK
jgi:hypothetical protein